MLSVSEGRRCDLQGMAVRSLQIMKSKLLIVADLGLVKAYNLDFTPNHTPRIEQLQEIVLEEAHSRLLDKLIDEKNLPRDLTKVGQKELLEQFLNANAPII
jgi:hypothetical protein